MLQRIKSNKLGTSSAEVKNAWSYTSTPQYASMTWCLKHGNNFKLTLPFTLGTSALNVIAKNNGST